MKYNPIVDTIVNPNVDTIMKPNVDTNVDTKLTVDTSDSSNKSSNKSSVIGSMRSRHVDDFEGCPSFDFDKITFIQTHTHRIYNITKKEIIAYSSQYIFVPRFLVQNIASHYTEIMTLYDLIINMCDPIYFMYSKFIYNAHYQLYNRLANSIDRHVGNNNLKLENQDFMTCYQHVINQNIYADSVEKIFKNTNKCIVVKIMYNAPLIGNVPYMILHESIEYELVLVSIYKPGHYEIHAINLPCYTVDKLVMYDQYISNNNTARTLQYSSSPIRNFSLSKYKDYKTKYNINVSESYLERVSNVNTIMYRMKNPSNSI